MHKKPILEQISFGQPVAEQEMQELAGYFVETEQWRQLVAGHKDVVYGPKGSGKSALYSLLLQKRDELFDRGIFIKPAETPKGSPAFRALATDPPETEDEFVVLWKLYFLCLVAEVLREYGVDTPEARTVYAALTRASLLDLSPLQALLLAVRKQVAKLGRARSFEAGLAFDPSSGVPIGVTAKLDLTESAEKPTANHHVGLDLLIGCANAALRDLDFQVWLVIDRLDVAFSQHADIEQIALRARCQMLGPAPSARGEPSTWYADTAAPQRNVSGNGVRSVMPSGGAPSPRRTRARCRARSRRPGGCPRPARGAARACRAALPFRRVRAR